MEILSLVVLTLGLLLAGCALTFAVAKLLPSAVVDSAKAHDRFVGIGSADSASQSAGGSGKRFRVMRPMVGWQLGAQFG